MTKILKIKLLNWSEEQYEKAIEALDNINPSWICEGQTID